MTTALQPTDDTNNRGGRSAPASATSDDTDRATPAQAKVITNKLNRMSVKLAGDITEFGKLLTEAYARKVHLVAGHKSWKAYVDATLGGFKPDTANRVYLVKIMRDAGLPYADVAAATGASERTVKADAKDAGITSDTRTAGQAKRTDGKAGNGASTKTPAQKAEAARAVAASARRALVAMLTAMSDDAMKQLVTDSGHGVILADTHAPCLLAVKRDADKPLTDAEMNAAVKTPAKVASTRKAGQQRRPLASVK